MKRLLIALAAIFLLSAAHAEGIEMPDMSGIYEFAREYDEAADLHSLFEGALKGDFKQPASILNWLKDQARSPVQTAINAAYTLVPPILLSALLSCMLPEKSGAGNATLLLFRLILLLGLFEPAAEAITTAETSMIRIKTLLDRITPLFISLFSAAGMEGTAAIISPTAAICGDIVVDLYAEYAIPVCRIMLCIAAAGNLNPNFSLKRFLRLTGKCINWGTGICTALFTGLLAMQGNMSVALDGAAAKTARFAVDSTAPIIGNGISEAWDSYLCGMLVVKNALGLSGIAALLIAGIQPILVSLLTVLLLFAASSLLDLFGDKSSSDAAEQIAEACKTALAICTSSFAIEIILIGGFMMLGKNLIG